MKISLLHYSGPPVIGGVEKVLARQAQLLFDNGHEVNLVIGRGEAFHPKIAVQVVPEFDSKNKEVLGVKELLDKGEVTDLFWKLKDRLYSELSAALDTSEVIIIHNICTLHKNLALTAAIFTLADENLHKNFIAWTHDLAWTSATYLNELHDGYPWNILKTANPQMKYVVISEHRKAEFSSLAGDNGDRIVVIPNGIDSDCVVRPDAALRCVLRETGFMERGPRLVIPMRITRRKNLEMALEVMPYLLKNMPDACLLITGPQGAHNQKNSRYFEELCRLRGELGLKKNVFFATELCEELSDWEVYELIRLADLIFLPSSEEGFGLPLLEAALLGTAVCCTDIPPFCELGKDDVTYINLKSSSGEIAQQVQNVISSSTHYRFRQRIISEYSWQRLYERLILPALLQPEPERL